jgi:hypothetical protein
MPGTTTGTQLHGPVDVVWTGPVQIVKQDGEYSGSVQPTKLLPPDITERVRTNLQRLVDELNGQR